MAKAIIPGAQAPKEVLPAATLVTEAIDRIDALFSDFKEISGSDIPASIAYSIVIAAGDFPPRIRAVIAGEPDEDLDIYGLAALLDGARNLPKLPPGAKAVLSAAHVLADAVADVLEDWPSSPVEAIAALALLTGGNPVAPAAEVPDDSAEPADVKERRRLAFDAAAQIDAMARVISREMEHDEFEHFLLQPMLNRIKSLSSVVVSVHGGDDERTTEEMREVIHG